MSNKPSITSHKHSQINDAQFTKCLKNASATQIP